MMYLYENNLRAVVIAAAPDGVPAGRPRLEVDELPPLAAGEEYRIDWAAGTVAAVAANGPGTAPADRRENAYNAEKRVEWPAGSGTLLTVTEAAAKWSYYAAEGDLVTADALTVLIAAAKEQIREAYPDGEREG